MASGCTSQTRLRGIEVLLSSNLAGGRSRVRTWVGLSRRFYIPEEAGRGQVAGVPVFVAFPAGVWACREEGRGPGGAPGRTNDLDAGPPPVLTLDLARERVMRNVWACPVGSRVRGRRAAAFIPSGCPRLAAAGAWGVFACGQRDQSDRRPGRPGAGASKTSDHALPASGPAHAAFGELVARARTWPSRIA